MPVARTAVQTLLSTASQVTTTWTALNCG